MAAPAVRRADADKLAPERRCIVTGATGDRAQFVRFVLAPDGTLIADVAERLPGRGMWVTATRTALQQACRRNLFARAARTSVRVPDDLAAQVEALLLRRCLDLIGLARRAGAAVGGYEKCRERLLAGDVAVLLGASDGNTGDRARLRAMAGGRPAIEVFTADELGLALGRERSVHVAVAPGRLADRLKTEAARLAGFRTPAQGEANSPCGGTADNDGSTNSA
jgi:predicted RNA-binding protein YlxR (DUF448 family)